MRWFIVLTLGGLCACDTPGLRFHGIEPVRIQVGQSEFDVRVDGLRAEAIRLNMEWAPRLASVAPRGIAAIEAVSGCYVHKLDGDAAQMVARLDCGDGPPPPLPVKREYDCDILSVDDGHAEVFCRPYPR